MSSFKFDLERSDYFKNRTKLLKSSISPKLSDAKANLGDELAQVIFDKLDEALKEEFGLTTPLKGPGDELWVSPSDLLLGKIALKPPFTPKCIQALTHKGILEIGEGLENKFRNEMELDKQNTLEKYKAELLETIDSRMKVEIKDVEIRERLHCRMEMEKQREEFEDTLKEELDRLQNRLKREYENVIKNHENSLKEKWEEKLNKEVKSTVDRMTQDFLVQLDEQEHILVKNFKLELTKQELLRDYDVKTYKTKTTEALRQLKHNLECTNLVNMMYVICSERNKCCEQKKNIESYYQSQIKELKNVIQNKDDQIKNLIEERNYQVQEVALRESCLLKVIKHFQRFINFALRAAPTQAEFLLSVEKMMVFELTKSVAKSDFPNIREEDKILAWRFDEKSKTPSRTSNLEVKDFHNCFNELDPPVPDNVSVVGEDDILPAMYFKNKMYVREDFRDMLSGEIEIRPSNELWNKDVQVLIDTWRQQPDVESSNATKSDDEKDTKYANNADYTSIYDERRSKQSAVQFLGIKNTFLNQKSSDARKASRKSSLKANLAAFMENQILEPVPLKSWKLNPSNILAAKDSLELLMERKKSNALRPYNGDDSKEHFEEALETRHSYSGDDKELNKELAVEARDSIVLRKISLAKKPSSLEVVSHVDSIILMKDTLEKSYEVKSKSSKLSSAKNSVELLRESLMKLKQPSYCHKKDLTKQALGIPSKDGTCCEICKRKDETIDTPSEPIQPRHESILKRDSLSDEKSVKISHIEIINLDDHDHIAATSVVSFNAEPQVYERDSVAEVNIQKQSSTVKKSRAKPEKNTKLKYSYKLKVLGDENAKEGEQSSDEFTADRIHSLINLMKDQPQLIHLFTAGTR